MPMLQDHPEPLGSPPESDTNGRSSPILIQALTDLHRPLNRRISEESIRTELCEGPIPDSPSRPATPEQELSNVVSDRAELIERLKRGESPTWIPNRHLKSLFHQNDTRSPPRTPPAPTSTSPPLLPAASITPVKQDGADDPLVDVRLQQGLNLERPRSALHSGDFTSEQPSLRVGGGGNELQGEDGTPFLSARNPWIASSPPRDYTPFSFGQSATSYRKEAFNSGISSISSSLSSSFVYKPPTSPLVQFQSNEDVDLSLPLNNINIATNSPRNPRRHTLNFAQSSPYINTTSQRQIPQRRNNNHPYQAHQPRRSLNLSTGVFPVDSSPQTPAFLRPRRPSFSLDASPLQHASMVGSYEESILRGRMSTTPSKPLEFMAQIGVLGLGKCKSSLRCPAHVTLPFSAVFYSYAITSHGRSKIEDGPSPYVGQVDLENGLPNPDEGQRMKRKVQARYSDRRPADEESAMPDNPIELSDREETKAVKPKRRSRSPRAPPGGRYRIPEKGQLQIIIKNQNKTAVKLFLVPYDLAGMEPGTKTFIRQRSYSAGPIIENLPETNNSSSANRPILRYLIHLHICCPSKGRFYLYKSIRVVFANRVPDGKERLRNEVTYPEPRFTSYKPVRVMHTAPASSLAAEQAFRRRSSGFSFANYSPSFVGLDGMQSLPKPVMSVQNSFGISASSNIPVESVPFGLLPRKNLRGGSASTASNQDQSSDPIEPGSWQSSAQDDMNGVEMTGPPAGRLDKYDKLNRGDIGYGGNAFTPAAANGRPNVTEGLLSQRLRSLGMQGYLSDDDVAQAEE
ncbi:hypothetical protein B0H66DRAFT_603175 [Apodospora peruviana]|uniref:Atos-like conserved domain-containing protein n=1 Tax=Apodospora peruviana TaxID=516989 RepID=A0AAE0I5K9_9PEZI|nr:hypothetical protein B0H66DRAFT_603175 [Apodospora peruviana]